VAVPDHFRLELFSPIGIAALVVTNGHTLAAYMPREKTVYRGVASPENAARFLRIMLSASEIANLLLGLPLILPNDEHGTVRLDANMGQYVLTTLAPEGRMQIFVFDQKTLRLSKWEIQNGNSETLARMTLADYRVLQGQAFPFEIVLSDLQGNQEAAIYYERAELNPSLPDTLFTLAPMASVQEKSLDEGISGDGHTR
jgi:outer membrane lipoprotein-sorting protein